MYSFDEVSTLDPQIAEAMNAEIGRQNDNIELIASENIVSEAVLRAADALRRGGVRVRTGRAVPAEYRADRVITLGEVEK
jgi:hypothetical protein